MSGQPLLTVSASRAQAFVTALLEATGVPVSIAREVAEALVEADLEGAASHGLLQLPNYIRRLRAGTISKHDKLQPVIDRGAIAVFDARLMLGHAGGTQAMEAAAHKAITFGLGAVAVRNGTHFGVCGRYARQATSKGLIGIAMCNTRPMMPAPEGSTPVVGNNPLAVGIPAAEGKPIVLDMAMSATAMGKIRQAMVEGRKIEPGLALDKDGVPTEDASAAISGMLLPAAGAKGFGLALMIDLLSGLLSGGSMGNELASMYGDPGQPADCSWLMMAIEPGFFGDPVELRERAAALARQISSSRTRTGATRPQVPGHGRQERRTASAGRITIAPTLAGELNAIAADLAVPVLASDLAIKTS